MRCVIWYHLYNLKNLKYTHGGVLIFATLLKLTLLHGSFSRFLNCTNGTKSRNAPQLMIMSRLVTPLTLESSCKWGFYTSFENKLCIFRFWSSICKIEIVLEIIQKGRSRSEFSTLSNIYEEAFLQK